MCFSPKDAGDGVDGPPRPVALPVNNNDGSGIKNSSPSPQQRQQDYAPPSGPPPSARQNVPSPEQSPRLAAPVIGDDFAPPPGPPPSYARGAEDYAPPPGPPPSQANQDYAPPAGPPPGQSQHDWQSAVPDNSLLPPPPSLFAGWDRSPTSNATEAQANEGEAWCKQFPLNFPAMSYENDLAAQDAIRNHNINVQRPSGYKGKLSREADGSWKGKTTSSSPDSCIIGYPPLYAPTLHSPLVAADRSGKSFTAYYEVHISKHSRKEVSLAMGFTAMPYPAFRLPGWHRGSLAVHGDDGHRYVNDMWGGKDFTKAFARDATYGIGMRFSPEPGVQGITVEVFFTVDGKLNGSWDLHEETDAEQDRPVVGLEGFHDLSIAIGTFDAVEFEVRLDPTQWMYNGDMLGN